MPIRAFRAGTAPILLLLLALAGCGGSEEALPARGGPPGRSGPAAVEAALVEKGTIARQVNVSGVVEPIRTIGINSQLAGALLEVPVEAGDYVREGQVLARIDDRELAVQEASAEANYNVAQAAFERAEQLMDRQVITVAEYERERTAFAVAEAALEQIRTRRAYATVVAPVSGIILEKSVEQGDIVGAQSRLFTIGDVSTLVVRVPVSELDVVALSVGDRVSVALDAYPGQAITGQIRRIFPAADPTTRLVPVEVALEGASMARPGFLARVSFPIAEGAGVLLVPASAVVASQGGGRSVFVVQNGTATSRPVTVGETAQGRVEIVSGLALGDTVLVAGNTGLRDGAAIRIVAGVGADDDGPSLSSNPLTEGGEL